jgi:hypothetical protein
VPSRHPCSCSDSTLVERWDIKGLVAFVTAKLVLAEPQVKLPGISCHAWWSWWWWWARGRWCWRWTSTTAACFGTVMLHLPILSMARLAE